MSNTALALEGGGLMLGRYRPLRPLGSGGSGSVWLVRDEQTGLDVALKIVPREGKAAARAEREAQAAAQLRHPSCLRAYAFVRDPRHVYIAYEFVPGRTFREALRAGELDDRAAIEACAQICDGLAHAHRAGILHRDVKPSNVLLADGGQLSVRILDFGLARMAEAETLTAQGDVPGTLAYIAPERLAGEDATGAADVWAVGVMLWEALSGRHPFWQSSMLETARAIEGGAPSLSALRPDLPNALLQLVDRSLSLNPSARPSAQDLADRLRGAATPRRATKRPRSGSIAVPSGAGRAGAVVLAAGFAGWAAGALPFFPHGWAFGLAAGAGALTAFRERAGLAAALAVPILPLGNVSLGLALVYTACAAGWLAISWRAPRSGLLFAVGALLAPIAALGLVPLVVSGVRSTPRRALQAALAVLAAALAAGLRGVTLPLSGEPAPLGVGVGGSRDPLAVAGSLARAGAAHPVILVEALAFAVLAAALPYARPYGRWGAAAVGAATLLLCVPVAPAAAVWPLVAAAWATALFLAVRAEIG